MGLGALVMLSVLISPDGVKVTDFVFRELGKEQKKPGEVPGFRENYGNQTFWYQQIGI
jgi:hypothetical protein